MKHIAPKINEYGFVCGAPGQPLDHVGLFTWIDNIYCTAETQNRAAHCMRALERYFLVSWGLKFKPSSKLLMLPKGAQDERCFDLSWDRVTEFPVLGHVISDSGGIRSCWEASKASLWRAFWGNCKDRRLGKDIPRSIKLLERSVYPILSFRTSRWPPQKTIASEMDRTHASMLASIQRTPPFPGEEHNCFLRRRMRLAHSKAKDQGIWSDRWYHRFVLWNEHLDRHPAHPCARILKTRDSNWLMQRRIPFVATNPMRWASWTSLAGRTDTRLNSGHVAQRWESGLELAKSQS